jgi:hypothetical protein
MITGTILQIYLEAIMCGGKVEEEIEKSCCGRHLKAISERYSCIQTLYLVSVVTYDPA